MSLEVGSKLPGLLSAFSGAEFGEPEIESESTGAHSELPGLESAFLEPSPRFPGRPEREGCEALLGSFHGRFHLQIRDLPSELHRTPRQLAAARGLSLRPYAHQASGSMLATDLDD